MRRAVFYLFYDPQGQVDDYVLHTLGHLRKHAEHIFVVSNSPLDDANRARLESVADTVWERENVGLRRVGLQGGAWRVSAPTGSPSSTRSC